MFSVLCFCLVQDPNALVRTQKRLEARIHENEKYYGIDAVTRTRNLSKGSQDSNEQQQQADQGLGAGPGEQHHHGDQDLPEADFSSGNKDTCVLEVKKKLPKIKS